VHASDLFNQTKGVNGDKAMTREDAMRHATEVLRLTGQVL
jgi:hypothetical protein